jgi:hypothetical protein
MNIQLLGRLAWRTLGKASRWLAKPQAAGNLKRKEISKGAVDARPSGDNFPTERADDGNGGNTDQARDQSVLDDLAALLITKDLFQTVHD